MTVNNELQWIWKEAVVNYLKILSRIFPGVTGEDKENPESKQSLSWPTF
jgi:hypothetical protein